MPPTTAELHEALSSRLQQFGYTTGPLPVDRQSITEAYLAVHRAREGTVAHRVPDDERELIEATIAALSARFCGVPEVQNTMLSGAPRGRWDRGHLTWSVNPAGCNWTHGSSTVNSIEAALWDGFRPWRRAHPTFFDFTLVPNGGDIQFSFGGAAADARFGVPNGTLAVGGYPDTAMRGRIIFDSAEAWTRQLLAAVAEHEVGHVLGLKHSSTPGSTMSPFVATYAPLDAETADTLRDMYAWTAPTRFADGRASSDGPALCTTTTLTFQHATTTVHIAWKGVEGDARIFISSSHDDGLTWTPQVELAGIRSSHGPALTGYRRGVSPSPDDIFIAWKGEGADERLFYATGFNGGGFASVQRLEGHTSNARPAVAEFQGRVHMAWKASTGDHVLWASWRDGAWSDVQVVPGVLTSHAPALAAFGDGLVLCWQGMGEDARIFQARLDAATGEWSAIQPVTYLDATAGAGGTIALTSSPIFTSHHPSMTAAPRSLVIGYKGQPGDDAVWLLRGFGIANGPVHITDALSSTGPGLTAVGEKIVCAWKAQAPDQALHVAIR